MAVTKNVKLVSDEDLLDDFIHHLVGRDLVFEPDDYRERLYYTTLKYLGNQTKNAVTIPGSHTVVLVPREMYIDAFLRAFEEIGVDLDYSDYYDEDFEDEEQESSWDDFNTMEMLETLETMLKRSIPNESYVSFEVHGS